MLSAKWQSLLLRVKSGLTSSDAKVRAALASELDSALLDDAASRAAAGQRLASGPRPVRAGRVPNVVFTIATEPGGNEQATGAAAAHKALERTLLELGALPARVPGLASFRVAMSRSGHWATLLETDNGTVAVTVTRNAIMS